MRTHPDVRQPSSDITFDTQRLTVATARLGSKSAADSMENEWDRPRAKMPGTVQESHTYVAYSERDGFLTWPPTRTKLADPCSSQTTTTILPARMSAA